MAKKKPTTGKKAVKYHKPPNRTHPFYTHLGDVMSDTHGIMWSNGVAYPAETMLGRFVEAYEMGRKSRNRAIAAAVRRERDRCVAAILDTPEDIDHVLGTINNRRQEQP